MRTYAPADVASVLAGLLDEPSLAPAASSTTPCEPAREAADRPLPGVARSPDRRGPRAARDRRASTPTRRRRLEAVRAGPRRLSSSRRRPRARRLCYDAPGPPGAGRRPVRPRPLPLPDQGARPGPGRRASRARRRRPARRSSAVDLRRRHAGADPLDDPRRPARSWSRTRTCSTRRSSPTTRSGSSSSSSSRSSWSTSCTRTAASSAATSPTSCAASCASAPTTARTRSSSRCSATIANPGELADPLTGRAPARRRPQRRAGRRAAPPVRRPAASSTPPRGSRLGAHRWPSAGRSPSCGPAARRSSSGARARPSS